MVYNLTYSANIFDTLGVLSSFSLTETIWTKYEKYAIKKLEESTLKLRGVLFSIKELSTEQADKELEILHQLIPIFSKLKDKIEPINDADFRNFKNAAIEFFNIVDLLYDNFHEVAQFHDSYQMSIAVLANDWDSKEDDHWDKY